MEKMKTKYYNSRHIQKNYGNKANSRVNDKVNNWISSPRQERKRPWNWRKSSHGSLRCYCCCNQRSSAQKQYNT